MVDERRQHVRVEWVSPGIIYTGDGAGGRPCIVSNLSNGGAKLNAIRADGVPDEFMLSLNPRRGPSRKCYVVWRGKNALGVEFAEPFPTVSQPVVHRTKNKNPVSA
jgi:hypothetical protein